MHRLILWYKLIASPSVLDIIWGIVWWEVASNFGPRWAIEILHLVFIQIHWRRSRIFIDALRPDSKIVLFVVITLYMMAL